MRFTTKPASKTDRNTGKPTETPKPTEHQNQRNTKTNGTPKPTGNAKADRTPEADRTPKPTETPAETVYATSVTITPNSNLELTEVGRALQLAATVYPENATNKAVKWTSDDPGSSKRR